MVLKPDIVVANLYDKRSTRDLLKAHGLRLAELPVPRTLPEVKDQIREFGDIVGHPDRAAAQIALLDAALARARQAVAAKHYRVLPLSRRGWVAGSDSFVGSLLAETGLFNTAGDLGFNFGGFASLEAIVEPEAGSAAGVAGRRFRARRRPGFSAASGARAVLSAGKTHRDPGTADRMRRRDAGGSA